MSLSRDAPGCLWSLVNAAIWSSICRKHRAKERISPSKVKGGLRCIFEPCNSPSVGKGGGGGDGTYITSSSCVTSADINQDSCQLSSLGTRLYPCEHSSYVYTHLLNHTHACKLIYTCIGLYVLSYIHSHRHTLTETHPHMHTCMKSCMQPPAYRPLALTSLAVFWCWEKTGPHKDRKSCLKFPLRGNLSEFGTNWLNAC